MCGIIGYVGKKPAPPILLEGLRRLEYRGYDSAGLAVLRQADLLVRKKAGKIDAGLATFLDANPLSGNLGIGHTRWATHGAPSDKNCHPHVDASGRIAVVHNGVIENYEALKTRLARDGHQFKSDTDTEVLAHLIGHYYARGKARGGAPNDLLAQAIGQALREVIGTYGIAVVSADEPGKIIAARRGSPLIIGIGKGEHFLASDANAIVAHTRKVVYLNDYDVATVTAGRFNVLNLGADVAKTQITRLEFNHQEAARGDHA
ncbi:MAG: class II glutamine amidotransferase, partial [Limisphaerales bacterium]